MAQCGSTPSLGGNLIMLISLFGIQVLWLLLRRMPLSFYLIRNAERGAYSLVLLTYPCFVPKPL